MSDRNSVGLYRLYLETGCLSKLKAHLDQEGVTSKKRISATGRLRS
jgi:hypothetical protein